MDGNDIRRDEPPMPPAVEAALLHGWHGDEASQRKKVLLLDDDRLTRMLAGIHLEAMLPGHQIVHAEDGKLGFDALQDDPSLAQEVGLIVTDLQMPRVDGIEFAHGLRGVNGYGHRLSDQVRGDLSRVPVVLHTGSDRYFEEGTAEHAQAMDLIDAGVIQAVTHKNHGPAGLRKAIEAAVRRMSESGPSQN